MKRKLRHIISCFITVIMIFSTVGFNIVTTFCSNCNEEHTAIILTPVSDRSCCDDTQGTDHCCAMEGWSSCENHQTSALFARLLFDSPEAKSSVPSFQVPQNLFFTCFLFLSELFLKNVSVPAEVLSFSPPISGRILLTLYSVLRN